MCCDAVGSEEKMVKECPECGGDVDEDGISGDICGYSPIVCETCGSAPCDDSC